MEKCSYSADTCWTVAMFGQVDICFTRAVVRVGLVRPVQQHHDVTILLQ